MSFRPISRLRQLTLRDIISHLLTGPVRVPYDRIGMYDSRLWDPEWAGTYGTKYTALRRVLSYGLNDPQKAATVASGESYRWGRRGGRPSLMLARFENVQPKRVVGRINNIIRRVTNGENLADILNVIGDPVPDAGAPARPASP